MASKNRFSALQMDSDSDSETKQKHTKETKQEPAQKQNENKAHVPHSPVLRIRTPTSSPPFRVWKMDEPPKNVFKSPFSQKKKKQKMENDKDGWVSIQNNQPHFVDDNASTESEQEIKKEVIMESLTLEPVSPPEFSEEAKDAKSTEFPSMLQRGGGMTAMDWAERVRNSLERAEQARNKPPSAAQKTEDFVNALGRLSFFRRPLTNDE